MYTFEIKMRNGIIYGLIILMCSCNQKAKTNSIMEQRLSVLTIGANDLQAMRKFYEENFGWKPVAVNKDIVFYKMNGFLFSIGERRELADFIGITPEGSGFRSFTFGYNVPTEEEVRTLYKQLKDKGVKILKEPTEPPFGGLFFYFEDIEGNIIEIAYSTFIPLDTEGNAIDHHSIDHL
jgi:catechol 2,3-dioxygenase-like lactoylglutathione lyase family enzyme